MAPTPQDPHDWTGIRASLDADPLAQLQAAQSQPLAGQDPRQLLAAYKALNNGALPPGMTPEQAMLIEMGLWTDAVQQNPALLQSLQSIATSRLQFSQDAQAARTQMGENYQNLTGDVEQQGTNFMADLMQRMGITDPQAIALDPTSQGYSDTIANMGETADQMQATDQAWFDKMLQVYDQSAAQQMLGLTQMPVVPAGGGGGGGGGGGFGRRGGRGGGSGGGSGWSDPSTTDAMTQSADVNAQRNYPEFMESAVGQFDNQQDIEAAKRMIDAYGGFPHNVAAGLVKNEIPNTEALFEVMAAQQGQRRGYFDRLPAETALAGDRAAELQRVAESRLGVTPETPAGPGVKLRSALTGFNKDSGTNELADYNTDVGAMLLQGLGTVYDTVEAQQNQPAPTGNAFFDQMLQRAPQSQRPDVDYQDLFTRAAQYNQQERDKERLGEAKKAQGTDFSFNDWKGYVPQVNVGEAAQQQRYYDVLASVLNTAREFSPNYDMQVTKQTMQDSSDTKTTQKSKDPANQLFDNNPIQEAIPDFFTPDPVAENMGMGGRPGFAGSTRGVPNMSDSLTEKMNAIREIALENSRSKASADRAGGIQGAIGSVFGTPAGSTEKKPPNWGGTAKKAASGAAKSNPSGASWGLLAKKSAASGAVSGALAGLKKAPAKKAPAKKKKATGFKRY